MLSQGLMFALACALLALIYGGVTIKWGAGTTYRE